MAQTENAMQKWLDGQITLGAAANWDKDEIRVISEIAYSLAQQGRNRESIVLFEGLLAVAPATAYFQSALGALHLRLKDFPKAIEYLDAALEIEPDNIISLVNRGEAKMKIEKPEDARLDFAKAVGLSASNPTRQVDINDEITLAVKRARALLANFK